MDVEETGLYQYRESTGNGSDIITVPIDADIALAVLVGFSNTVGWLGSTPLSLDGNNFTQIYKEDVDQLVIHLWLGYLANPTGDPWTASEMFEWTVTGSPPLGMNLCVLFFKNVNKLDPIKDWDWTGQGPSPGSGRDVLGLEFAIGDLMVGFSSSWNDAVTVTDQGQTEILVSGVYNQTRVGIGKKLNTGDFSTTGGSYQKVVAVVLNREESAGEIIKLDSIINRTVDLAMPINRQVDLVSNFDLIEVVGPLLGAGLNLDFELYTGTQDDGVSDAFTGWDVMSSLTATVEATATVQSGSNAVKIIMGKKGVIPQLWRDIRSILTPGGIYKITFWCRGIGGLPQILYYISSELDGYLIPVNTPTNATGTTYTKITNYFTMPSNNAFVNLFFLQGWFGGYAYVNSVEIREVFKWEILELSSKINTAINLTSIIELEDL